MKLRRRITEKEKEKKEVAVQSYQSPALRSHPLWWPRLAYKPWPPPLGRNILEGVTLATVGETFTTSKAGRPHTVIPQSQEANHRKSPSAITR